MELSAEFYVAGVVFAVTLVLITWTILDPLWFHPKKIEGSLRAQGLKGSSYKFMFGDSKEMAQMTRQAKSKPIDLKDDIGTRVLPFVQKSVAAYGKMCFTWMGPTPTVQVSEPAIIKEILADYYKFQKSRGHPLFKKLMKGLIDVEGDQWVKHRKIINPAFHLEKLKQMIPAFYVSCDDMIQKWKELVINESSCEVDVCPYIEAMSNDVISRTAFGSSFEEGRKIFELLHELLVLVVKSIQSDYFPGSRIWPTARNRRMNEIDQKVKDSIRVIVDKRLVAMKAGEIGSTDDLLGILLKSNNEEIKQEGNTKSGLSMEEIIEECKLFYVAGQETTRNVLIWTMVLLGQYTDWQARARDEVLHVFKDKKPDFEGLSHLKVVNMIFNEVLRLYPPVALLGRKIHKETKLGDIMLPAGTLVQVNTLLLHYDSEIWGDDVDEFKPERFSEGVSKVTKGLTCYLPFGGGPRICIGQNFAILEAKLVLAMILQNFAFEISPSYAHAPHLLGTIQPQFGTHLILHKL